MNKYLGNGIQGTGSRVNDPRCCKCAWRVRMPTWLEWSKQERNRKGGERSKSGEKAGSYGHCIVIS